MLGNWLAMKSLAVRSMDRQAGGPLCGGSADARAMLSGEIECVPASQAFDDYDAKDGKGDTHLTTRANLKPNIYYKAQDLNLGAHRLPGCRGLRRADRDLGGKAGEEGEPVNLGVGDRPGATETSPAPDRTVHAGSSFDEPVAWMVEDAACDC